MNKTEIKGMASLDERPSVSTQAASVGKPSEGEEVLPATWSQSHGGPVEA